MTNEIIVKTLRTYGHSCVCGRHISSPVIYGKDKYRAVLRTERGGLSHRQRPAVKKYRKSGRFNPNAVEELERSGADILEQHLKTRMQRLTLQVTQQCNLHCEDCIYSGRYDGGEARADMRMSLEMAKRAIDFFCERSSELSDAIIGFYGGEPLLEFELIKQCVEYAKSQVEGKRILFNMATNGTLLSDDIAGYLAENNFILNVSPEGLRNGHSASRHDGPCIPGVRHIFVRADGALFPCECVNEELDYFKIGTLDYGINIDQVRKMLNICNLTKHECSQYWDVGQCTFYTERAAVGQHPPEKGKAGGCVQRNGGVSLDLCERCVRNDFALDME